MVDGYNAIHCLPDFRHILQRDLDLARQRFSDWVRRIHDQEHIRLSVVFDGNQQQIQIERPTGDTSYSIIYSPQGSTADAVIEQLFQQTKDRDEITVVSEDHLIVESIRSGGGLALHPNTLTEWVNACQTQQYQAAPYRKAKSSPFTNRIDIP